MSIETSLTYQKKFFSDFTDAWHKKSRYRLYQGIDATAENLRLDIEEAPGYILAYDKSAQAELHDFLQIGFIDFLRQHIPFFEVNDQGTIYFGNWYHRRDFGHINVILRAITQSTDEQRKILPQLEAFSDDPDHYLDRQLDAMRKEVYRDVDSLHTQIDNLEAEAAPERDQSAQGNGGFRGLLKNFIDPSDDPTPQLPMHPKPMPRNLRPALIKKSWRLMTPSINASANWKFLQPLPVMNTKLS